MSAKLGKFLVLGAACGLLAAAVEVSALVRDRQGELESAARCVPCGAALGAQLAFTRLEQRVAATRVPGSGVGVADVRLRLDALADRAAALDGADVPPGAAPAARRLAAALAELAPLAGRVGEPGVGEDMMRIMAPIDFDLSHLAAEAERAGEARAAAARDELGRLYRVFTTVLALFVMSCAGLLASLVRHNRRLGQARDGLERTAEELRGASHELAAAHDAVSSVNEQLATRNASLDRREREMRVQNRRFDAALNNMSMALCMVDAADRLVIYNQPFAEMFGLDFAPIPGLLFADLAALAGGPQLGEVHARQSRLAAADGSVSAFVQELPRRSGPSAPGAEDRLVLAVSHRPMREGGWVATYEDITVRRRAEARIAYLARHDALTGLLNRAAFAAQVDAALAEAPPRGGAVAVHCIDLDGFREINDRFGHAFGDALLNEAGRRLAGAAGGCVVARLGGDEFAVLQAGAAPEEVEALAAHLVGACREPFAAAGHAVAASASVGHAAAGPADGGAADVLMKAAELALAAARAAGGGRSAAFAPDMEAARRARRALEDGLRRALAEERFEVHFQPLVDARAGRVTGFEALLRWRDPERGLVSPVEFIPVAEEMGLIGAVGAWALREACARAARWPGAPTVAVNLSPAQFATSDLPAVVDAALAHSGLDPRRLELEITESVPLGDGPLAVLHALKARGIRIAMDDFGTGYSSLSYLRRFPFDKIKIDQSFVRELSSRPDCIKIVRAIASLGASLGMTTTAEGVETAEQAAQLLAAGCDQLQGFHFGRPSPDAELRFEAAGERAAA